MGSTQRSVQELVAELRERQRRQNEEYQRYLEAQRQAERRKHTRIIVKTLISHEDLLAVDLAEKIYDALAAEGVCFDVRMAKR
jgi:hypothetical protein